MSVQSKKGSQADRFINSAKYPIRFDRLHPGSYFRIFGEPSRGLRRVHDERVYRKASLEEGFYATSIIDGTDIVLYPEDMVQPIRKVRA